MAHDRNFETYLNIEYVRLVWLQMLRNCFFVLIDIFSGNPLLLGSNCHMTDDLFGTYNPCNYSVSFSCQ